MSEPGAPTGRASTRTIELSGGPVELLDLPAAAGEEQQAPLVLLHEGLGSVSTWRGFPAALAFATGRRVLAWSRYGYGASGPARLPRRADYLHEEALVVLPELLGALGVRRPVLVGHSDGASIALVHAGAGGGEVDALALLAPHVMVEERSLRGIEAARERFETTDLAARLARHHADPAGAFWGWNDIWLSPEFRSWNIEDAVEGIRADVLGVQALDDEYGSLEQLERIDARLGAPMRRLVLADGGHSPHLSHPDQVVAAVADLVATSRRPERA